MLVTVISARRSVMEVAEKWKGSYYDESEEKWSEVGIGDPRTIYRELKTLPDGATPADAEAIIGNGSWVGTECAICGNHTDTVVVLNAEYASELLEMCPACARALAKELNASLKK